MKQISIILLLETNPREQLVKIIVPGKRFDTVIPLEHSVNGNTVIPVSALLDALEQDMPVTPSSLPILFPIVGKTP